MCVERHKVKRSARRVAVPVEQLVVELAQGVRKKMTSVV